MPSHTASANGLRLVADKFGQGTVAPLTVVVEADEDLRKSSGLAWLDQVSRMLDKQDYLTEVRSATQPLGSTAPLDPARLSNRFAAVNEGFGKLEAGATQLKTGLAQGLDKLRATRWLQDATGLRLTNLPTSQPTSGESPKPSGEAITNDLVQAGSLVSNPIGFLAGRVGQPRNNNPKPTPPARTWSRRPDPDQAHARPDGRATGRGGRRRGADRRRRSAGVGPVDHDPE